VPFEVLPAQVGGHLVLCLVGELDAATAPVLADAVTRALETAPATLVLDLSPTTFLDSSGARQLARAARQAARAGTAAQLVCPKDNRTVRLVVDLLELQAMVPVLDTTDEVTTPPRP